MLSGGRKKGGRKKGVGKSTKKILEVLSNSIMMVSVTIFVQCLNTAYAY